MMNTGIGLALGRNAGASMNPALDFMPRLVGSLVKYQVFKVYQIVQKSFLLDQTLVISH